MKTKTNKFEKIYKDIPPDPKWFGLMALNQFLLYSSSPRLAMMGQHLAGMVSLIKGEERMLLSGYEKELSKTTFSRRAESDILIVDIVRRYKFIKEPQEIIVFYKNLNTDQLEHVSIPNWESMSQYFGYNLDWSEMKTKGVRIGTVVKKGDYLAKTPGVKENDGYAFGVNVNVANMSIPEVPEDSIVMSESMRDKFQFDVADKRVFTWGEDSYLAMIHGDKPILDIGDRIPDNGLIAAVRRYNVRTALSSMSPMGLKKPLQSDKLIYAREPGGEIIDMKVIYNPGVRNRSRVLGGPEDLLMKYAKGYDMFMEDIVNVYVKNKNMSISPATTVLFKDAKAHVNRDKLKIYNKKELMKTWHVEVTIKHRYYPNKGFKPTGLNGNKVTVGDIWPDECMPVDKDGVRADVIADPASIASRMNISVLYDGYISAAVYRCGKYIRENKDKGINFLFNHYKGLADIINPHYARHISSWDMTKKTNLINSIVDNIIQYPYPIKNKSSSTDISDEMVYVSPHAKKHVKAIRKSIYAPAKDKLTYIYNGVKRVTDRNIMVMNQYTIGLSKITDDWIAASSGYYNHDGVPANPSGSRKNELPWSNNSPRIFGATEFRLYGATAGPKFLAEYMDYAKTQAGAKKMTDVLLTSERPSNLKELINRETNPYKIDNSVQSTNAVINPLGVELKYIEENFDE